MDENSTANVRTSGLGDQSLLIFGWLWVGVPLAWGVFETVRKSLELFR